MKDMDVLFWMIMGAIGIGAVFDVILVILSRIFGW